MVDRMSPGSGIDAFQDLERWLAGHAAASAGLSELERESERRGREILRICLQVHIDARGNGDVGEALVVASEQGELRLTHKRPRVRRSTRSMRSCAYRAGCGAMSASAG